jgi:ribose/xylose/arabinose/galactoside ABC-type transport system permease subunit
MTWKTILSFVLVATLLTILVGWLTTTEVLPIQQSIRYSNAGRNFIRIWLWVAIALGFILPSIAWIARIKRSQPRRILGFYLLVLVIQIVTEQISSRIGIPSLVVTVGTLHTAFRIWQLWQGQQLIQMNSSSPTWMSRPLA